MKIQVVFRYAILTFLSAALLPAQSFQARISGEVKDRSGAIVPRCQVTAVNVNSGVKYNAVSNEAGVYHMVAMQPDKYKITAVLQGFKTFEQTATLQVNQVLDLDITLDAGQVTEKVTVTSEAPPLETASATLGQVVTTRSILALPLNIRDPFALVGLTPGVTFGANFGNGGGNDVGRNFFKSDFNVGGGRSGSQEILLDGAANTTPDINRGIINPPVDSVQEFKVQANSYDAEFGRTSGGVINMVTKGGTNEFHGVAYDFERHSNLDANNFFNNRAGRATPSFARHQYGGNVGGPAIKNKLFFFADYEGLRQGFPSTAISTLPTAQQRAGDFSKTFAANGALIQVYDPSTLIVLADGSRQRTAFPGNVIPASRFDAVAAKTVPFYPDPNTAGAAVTGQNNYIFTKKSITNGDKYDTRGDVNLTDATRMFFRFSRQTDARIVPGTMPLPIGGGRQTSDHYTQAVADLTHVFSATMVADVQVSGSRALASQFGSSDGFDLNTLGFPSSFVSQVPKQFSIFSLSDVAGTANGGDSFVQFQPRNVWAARGTLTYLRGKHSMKYGGEWRGLHFNEGQLNAASGLWSFSRTFTQGPNPVQASATSGYGLASFLLGTAASGSINKVNPISTRSTYGAFFVQDDWRVTNKLTLNLGLRWDLSTGDKEKYNRLAFFDPTASNPLGAKAGLPNLTGLLTWIGQGNPNQQASALADFGPRFGMAYQITPKTVLRGGYAIFFLPRNVQGNGAGAVEAFRTTNYLASVDGVTPANRLANPYPQGILPALNDRDPLVNAGNSLAAPTYAFRSPYSQTWSMGLQRELPGKLLLDVHYWGNKGTRLLETWNLNQLPDPYLALGNKLNDQVANPFFNVLTSGNLTGSTISRQQSLLPYPQYLGITQNYVQAGNSTYHAGTIQAERRMSSTFTFMAQYTRSKAIDDVRTPLDMYNRKIEKSLSAFDAPNQFVFSGVHQLPFGRGRKFGGGVNKLTDAVLGGWDLSGIIRIQSGQPIGVGRIVNNGTSARLDNPTIDKWFNTSVFSNTPAFTYGNVGPVLPDVRTHGLRNIDTVLAKNVAFHVKERKLTLQFRAEFYNLFNHVQFGGPNGSVTSQSFGQVSAQANNPRDIQFGLKLNF